MILYPAIDIQDGRAVRLRQGRFEDETVYADDPLDAARDWVEAGAKHLHVVDLDGARHGEPRSLEHLERIAALGVPVQYGGGLRSLDAVRGAFAAGAAARDPRHRGVPRRRPARRRGREFGERDRRRRRRPRRPRRHRRLDGDHAELPAPAAIVALQDRGVRSFVYTDADRDGMLEGPDLDEVRAVAEAVRGRFIYSGGIGTARAPARAARSCGC